MIIFYGSRDIKKTVAENVPRQCNRCQQSHNIQIQRNATWFTLFFIPIFPYVTNYFLRCPECGIFLELEKSEAKALIAGARQ